MVFSGDADERKRASMLLAFEFDNLEDKDQAWKDLIKLTSDLHSNVRWNAAYALSSSFLHVPDKDRAWEDLHRLTGDKDGSVRWGVARALGSSFQYVSNKDQAWEDLHSLTGDEDSSVRCSAAEALGLSFQLVSDKDQAWEDLHMLTGDRDRFVRSSAAEALGSSFQHVFDKDQALQNLHSLTNDCGSIVRGSAARALGSSFQYISEKDQVWQDLVKLTGDQDGYVRMFAYHSLGKASVLKAIASGDASELQMELEVAVGYFERSAGESEYNPARFCYPFYRTYLAITFKGGSQEAVQKYLADAKEAIGSSESKDGLLNAVENLAGALQESRRTKDMILAGMQCDLKAYMRYCNQATEYLHQVEKDAPGAAKMIKMGLPIIDLQIKEIIDSIQKKARQICIKGKGTGAVLEPIGIELNHWAKELSSEDGLKLERSCSRIEYTLQNFCSRIPADKRSNICEIVKEIGLEEELPNKLTKIELALVYILNESPIDYDVMKKLDQIHGDIKSLRQCVLDRFEQSEQKVLLSVFERLAKDKLEIVNDLLDAVRRIESPKSWPRRPWRLRGI